MASRSDSKVMQREVKDDVLQEHPTVNDALLPLYFPTVSASL